MNKIIVTTITICSIVFLFNCTPPGEEEIIHSKLDPPAHVTAVSEDPDFKKQITIKWDRVEKADYYKIYKMYGSHEPVLIKDSATSLTSFTFLETIHSQIIWYMVQSLQDDAASELSQASNPVTLTFEEIMMGARPDVESFVINEGGTSGIYISWKADVNAEGYSVFRSDTPCDNYTGLFTTESELSYFDTDVTLGEFYYYRLCYINGGEIYGASDYAFGVASVNKIDIYENNNRQDVSQQLEFDSIYKANIFYYADSTNNLLVDYDWYHIIVPPGTQKIITFTIPGIQLDGNLLFEKENDDPVPVYDLDGYKLINYEDENKAIYFKLYIDISKITNIFAEYEIMVSP